MALNLFEGLLAAIAQGLQDLVNVDPRAEDQISDKQTDQKKKDDSKGQKAGDHGKLLFLERVKVKHHLTSVV